jgi:hypothetical protein
MRRTGRTVRVLSLLFFLAFGPFNRPGAMGQMETPDGQGRDSVSAWAELRLQELESLAPTETDGIENSLERIRAMYLLSVDEGDWVDEVKDSLSALELRIPLGSEHEFTVEAYRGALEVVRAKHARWPPNKLKHLGNGAAVLDDLVARNPGNLEVRYLRLASYLFLPFFLRRDESVAADLGFLVDELPYQASAFSPFTYRAMARFVLDNGALEPEERTRLEEALEAEKGDQFEKRTRFEEAPGTEAPGEECPRDG